MTEEKAVASTETAITPTKDVKELPDIVNRGVNTPQPFNNEFDIASLLPTAGCLDITDEQKEILFAPVKEGDVEIRPDGLIYLPWMEYVNRLKSAFGLSWAIIPQGMPKHQGNLIAWGFYLIIKGKLMGFAIGEQEYYPNNPTMSLTDAYEGAKSNALMRLCKGIGISLELWKPSYVKEWKSKYAESYWGTNRYGEKKLLWKKQGAGYKKEELDDGGSSFAPISTPVPSIARPNEACTEAQRKKIFVMCRETGTSENELKRMMMKQFKTELTWKLSREQASDLIKFLMDLNSGMKSGSGTE